MKTKDPEILVKSLRKRIKEVNQLQLKVGIPKEESAQDKEGDTIFLADIAYQNNFGSISRGIPARPFGTTTVPRYKDKINKVMKTWLRDAIEGRMEVVDAYDRIGFTVAGYMKKNLTHGEWQGNSEKTIKLKGSDQPLIDQGNMRQAITWITEDVK